MKSKLLTIAIIAIAINPSTAQNKPVGSGIDLMLIRGNYEKVIDTCKQILTYDTFNPDVYYKMGIAYQNLLEDELSLTCFDRAANLNPDNKDYSFMLAKGYYGKGKYNLAGPLFVKLCSADSLNWLYSSYLTGIYMQSERYDDAINIYKRFLKKDSANCSYIDRLAFATLKKKDYEYATELFNKSLSINNKNISAIKNLAYLYSVAKQADTAVYLLTKGIEIDSADMDLYARRAQINYSRNYTRRALNDYLVILSSGDSSVIYLKRAGIGYSYNLQPRIAIKYLLAAYKKDSSDYETCSFLGQCYYNMKEMKTSVKYYNRVVKILTPITTQMGYSYVLLAESQSGNEMYEEAIANYLKAQGIREDPNYDMEIANLYDEKLGNSEKAIYHYQKFLDGIKIPKAYYSPEYVKSIKDRLEYLKTNPVK